VINHPYRMPNESIQQLYYKIRGDIHTWNYEE